MSRLSLQAILRSIPAPALILSEDGTVCDLNAEAAALFATPARSIVGERFRALFSADAAPAIDALLALARTEPTGDSPPSATVSREPAGGGAFWIDVSVRQIADQTGFFAVAHDVTGDRAVRARLTETANLLDTLIAAAPVGLGFLSRDLTFVRVNQILAARLGLPAHAIIGRPLGLVTPALAPVLAPLFRHVAETGEPLVGQEITEPPAAAADEQKTWLVSLYPVLDAEGAIELVGAAVIDITPRQRAHAAMTRAVTDRERLLAVVSHDLRSPLGSILLAASILERVLEGHGRLDRARALRYAAGIRRAAQRMERLIGDLLDFASVRAGRMNVRRELLPAAELLDELLEAHEAVATDNGIHLICRMSENEPQIYADRARVLQMLSNLVGNALKHTPAGGEIAVSVLAMPDGDTLISVQDTGPGIDPAMAAPLFEAYQRGKLTGAGIGLGLFIARGIAEAHGGRLWLDERYRGGARFCVFLPGKARAHRAVPDRHFPRPSL